MFTTAAKNAAVDAIAALITHVAAHSTVPNDTGSGEVVGTPYARQPVAWAPAAGGAVSNMAPVSISIPAGASVVAFGFWNTASGGVYRGHALVGNSKRGVGTVDAGGVTGNLIQSAGHGLVNGDRVVVYPVFGEPLPGGLVSGTVYWVVQATGDVFGLSLTEGGPAVNVTSQGELLWADCVPVTYELDGMLTVGTGQLILSGSVI